VVAELALLNWWLETTEDTMTYFLRNLLTSMFKVDINIGLRRSGLLVLLSEMLLKIVGLLKPTFRAIST
jgi:hypothetical protein